MCNGQLIFDIFYLTFMRCKFNLKGLVNSSNERRGFYPCHWKQNHKGFFQRTVTYCLGPIETNSASQQQTLAILQATIVYFP